jgi:hypothetical protein
MVLRPADSLPFTTATTSGKSISSLRPTCHVRQFMLDYCQHARTARPHRCVPVGQAFPTGKPHQLTYDSRQEDPMYVDKANSRGGASLVLLTSSTLLISAFISRSVRCGCTAVS